MSFAVALEDGAWHHERSYTPERAHRPSTVALWHKVTTVEDAEWTRRYHSADLREKAFGGRAVIEFTDGSVIEDEIAVAAAHPLGAHPFGRTQYLDKFTTLATGVIEPGEQERFLELVQRLGELRAGELDGLRSVRAAGSSR